MAIDNIKQMYLGHRKVSTLIHLTKRWLPLQKTVQKVAGLDWSNDIVENFQLNIKESESCHCISHDMQTNTTYSLWKKSCMISIYNNKFFLSHPCNILLVVQKKKISLRALTIRLEVKLELLSWHIDKCLIDNAKS